MCRLMGLAVILTLMVGFTLLPGSAWAWGDGSFVAVRSGHTSVFVRNGFVQQHRFFPHRFVSPVFVSPVFASPVIVERAVVVVEPVPQPMWVPGFWSWNGFQWVWVPGQWAW